MKSGLCLSGITSTTERGVCALWRSMTSVTPHVLSKSCNGFPTKEAYINYQVSNLFTELITLPDWELASGKGNFGKDFVHLNGMIPGICIHTSSVPEGISEAFESCGAIQSRSPLATWEAWSCRIWWAELGRTLTPRERRS